MAKRPHVVLASKSAFTEKYGAQSSKDFAEELARFTSAKNPAVPRQLIFVDDAMQMASLGLSPKKDRLPASCVRAVAYAVHKRLNPRSILLAGAWDIFEHQKIKNRDPHPDQPDGDELYTDTPLSFANAGPEVGDVYDWKDLRKPTAAIARLGGPVHQKGADAFMAQLQGLLTPRTRGAANPAEATFVAAPDKRVETQFAMKSSFPKGKGVLVLNPATLPAIKRRLNAPLQFVSAHSAESVPYHTGTAAISHEDLPKDMGDVAAFYLSCWGGYQHEWHPDAELPWLQIPPMVEGYMSRGATAFVGALSTTYTLSSHPHLYANGLVTRMFRALRNGRSLGDAFVAGHRGMWTQAARGLETRYARKTLMQFSLMGDPAVTLFDKPGVPFPFLPPPEPSPSLPLLSVTSEPDAVRDFGIQGLPDGLDKVIDEATDRARSELGVNVKGWDGYRLNSVKENDWVVILGGAKEEGKSPVPNAKRLKRRPPTQQVVVGWVKDRELQQIGVMQGG